MGGGWGAGGLSNVTSDDSTHIYLMLIMDKRRGDRIFNMLGGGGGRGKWGKEKGEKKTLLYVHRKIYYIEGRF